MDCNEFKKWLVKKNKYTDASIKDIVSRLNQCEEFQKASVTVKSQIRRSVRLYFQYLEETENTQ